MDNNRPLISVIVPVYNSEKHLKKCIDSVFSQTYQNWELVLVDDGSSDTSGEICDYYSWSDKRVKVIHQNNAGVSAARNTGIETAGGQYIMFIDSDDSITEDCIEILYTYLTNNQADIAAGRTCDEKYAWNAQKDMILWRGDEGIRNSLMDNPFTYAAWGKLYHRDAIGDVRFRTDIRINEDSFFVFQVLCRKPVFICVNQRIYYYNNNPESASRAAFSEKFFDIIKVSDLKYEIIKSTYLKCEKIAQNMCLKARMNLLHILALRTKKEYCDLEKELIRYICVNRNAYISVKRSDDRWMFIIQHGLYYPYKILMRLKKGLKKDNVKS